MRHAAIILLLLTAGQSFGQIVPPIKPPVVKVPVSVKATLGKATPLVIENPPAKLSWLVYPKDGISIWREHSDDARLLKLRIEVAAGSDGKPLRSEYALTVNVDGDLRLCVISVDGADKPKPTDPLAKLTDAVTKLTATVAALDGSTKDGFAKLDARVTALEAPRPPPKPPEPPVPPSPIPEVGFRVIIIEDKEKLSLLPAQQLSIRTSKVFRDYLDANCVTEPDGKTKGYRIWDFKTDASADLKVWRDALARPRTSMPWLIVSNPPMAGYEGPLPANVDDTITLLRKVKGN